MPLRPLVLLILSVLFLPAAAAQWTVGVYMCADNGMSDQADIDIAEMQQVGSTEEVNVVVQVDRAARDPRPGCYRYFIKKDGADTIADLGEVDMADPTTLAGFADFLRRHYPATNYVLILWDHGDGWYSGYRASAIFRDESNAHMMGVAGGEFAQAMAGVKQSLGKRARILAFDACLMGMVEVAAEVRDDCDYVLASEALVPWNGLPYDKFLDRLTSRPTRTPAELLPDVCRDYVEQYPNEQVTLSALDMRGLDRAIGLMKTTLSDSIGASNAELRAARAAVQTIPGNSFHVDLIHFFELLAGTLPDSLLASFRSAVIASEHGPDLGHVSGLAIWFPGNYLALKNSIASYMTLGFAGESGWPQFLNRYFGTDDVKPGQPAITKVRQGSRSDSRLWWNSCFDLAPVRYSLYEATRPEVVFNDYGDDLSNWIAPGWTTSTQQAHSGSTSLFSGLVSKSFIESADTLRLPGGGLLSFYAWYKTKEDLDLDAAGVSRNVCYVEWSPVRGKWQALDSLYGDNRSWHERRYPLPPTQDLFLRFRYISDADTTNEWGVFLDDIKVYAFDTMRTAAADIPDTTAAVFGVPHDTLGYYYFVTATDSFGNVSMASQFHDVAVKTWAEPYTRPAPFAGACNLVLDFPAGQTPEVLIYTLSGTLVRRFEASADRVRAWEGKNQAGRELADGLYLVVVQGPSFKKLGKIAKVARP